MINPGQKKFYKEGLLDCLVFASPILLPLGAIGVDVALNTEDRIQRVPHDQIVEIPLPVDGSIKCAGRTVLKAVTSEGVEVSIPLPPTLSCKQTR